MKNLVSIFPMILMFGLLAFGCSGNADDTSAAEGNTIGIMETTNVTVNDHQVAAANIGERELPDAGGDVAMRMSAILSIMDSSTGEEWTVTVVEGDSVVLSDMTYRVQSITGGQQSRGMVTLMEVSEPQDPE